MARLMIPLLIWLLLSPTLSWAAVSVANNVIASTAGAASLTTGTFSATAGNTLVVLGCSKTSISMDIATSGTDTRTNIDTGSGTPGSGSVYLVAFYNIAGGGSYTVSVTPGGGTPTMTLVVIELAGVPTSAVYDSTAGVAVANITPANTSAASGSTGTLSQADEIAIGYLCSDSGVAATATQDTGYTLSNSELAGGTKAVGAMSYKIVAATPAVSHTWATDSATSRVGVVPFKAGSAAAETFGFYKGRAR